MFKVENKMQLISEFPAKYYKAIPLLYSYKFKFFNNSSNTHATHIGNTNMLKVLH